MILAGWMPVLAAAEPAPEFPLRLVSDRVGDGVVPARESNDGTHPLSLLDVEELLVTDERDDTLTLGLRLAWLETSVNADAREDYVARYELIFALQGVDARYRVALDARVVLDGDGRYRLWVGGPLAFTVCAAWETADCQTVWTGQVQVDAPGRLLGFEVPKEPLTHVPDASGEPRPVLLAQGSRFVDFVASSRVVDDCPGVCFPPSPPYDRMGQDRAPDQGVGASYALRFAAPSPFLGVQVGEQASELAVLPGVNQTVRFGLANLRPEKRVVQVSYELLGGPDRVAGFGVWGPSLILIGPNQWRNFTLALEASTRTPEEWPRLLVRASVPGTQEYRVAIVQVTAGMVLTPDHHRFHLHALVDPAEPLTQAWQCDSGPCTRPLLNDQGSDPRALTGGRVRHTIGGQDTVLRLDAERGLGQVVALDPTGRVVIEATVGTSRRDVPGVELTFELGFATAQEPRRPLAVLTTEQDLTTAGTPVRLSGAVKLPNGPLVPAGARFWLAMAGQTGPEADGINIEAGLDQLWIAGSTSVISLPVTDLPEHAKVVPNPSPFHVQALDEREAFVNPGESRLFNLSVTNIDAFEHRLFLAAEAAVPQWHARILPGAAFALRPGESVRVGLLVTAPANAAEGERAVVTLVARADAGSARTDKFLLVATSVEQTDDEGLFQVDREDEAKLLGDRGAVPGPGAVAVFASLVLLLLFRRRRTG